MCSILEAIPPLLPSVKPKSLGSMKCSFFNRQVLFKKGVGPAEEQKSCLPQVLIMLSSE